MMEIVLLKVVEYDGGLLGEEEKSEAESYARPIYRVYCLFYVLIVYFALLLV